MTDIVHENGWWIPAGDCNIGKWVRSGEPYQQHVLNAALKHVRSFRTAVDVGAHIGLHTRRFLEAGFQRVLAVEPNAENLECLRRNIDDARVEIVSGCLGERHRLCNVWNANPGDSGRHLVTDGATIAMRTLDSLCTHTDEDDGPKPAPLKVAPVDLIKIDTEGYEPLVIYGALLTLMHARPVVIAEDLVHYGDFGAERFRVSRILSGLGYHAVYRTSKDSVYVHKP